MKLYVIGIACLATLAIQSSAIASSITQSKSHGSKKSAPSGTVAATDPDLFDLVCDMKDAKSGDVSKTQVSVDLKKMVWCEQPSCGVSFLQTEPIAKVNESTIVLRGQQYRVNASGMRMSEADIKKDAEDKEIDSHRLISSRWETLTYREAIALDRNSGTLVKASDIVNDGIEERTSTASQGICTKISFHSPFKRAF